MKKLFLCFFIFNSFFSSAQNPLVKMWDKRFGGTDEDLLTSFQKTSDRGYILGGTSASGIGGDKTQPSYGGYDYWMVKTDSLGNKEWDKRYGGTNYDWGWCILQTQDGYIIGGFSRSNANGDKTDINRDPTEATVDYWVLKIDSWGNKLWDKTFGGDNNDILSSIALTSDGGYLLIGYSNSNSSGDKTDSTKGLEDFWIVKIDSIGNKQWDKTYGGSFSDESRVFLLCDHGDVILGGESFSGISGDKTEVCRGSGDFWVIKIDSLGNKLWDKTWGGDQEEKLWSLSKTEDGGLILGGISGSGISGDKTKTKWDAGWTQDFWMIKTDSIGNKEWDSDLGGTNDESHLATVFQTQDGGYLLSGDSYSPIGGDKSENNLGFAQTWLIKTDSTGIKVWDKTILTPNSLDDNGILIQSNDGCYLIANFSNGGVGGYKSQPAWNNSHDYWIIKFCDSTLTTSIADKESEHLTLFPNPTESIFTAYGLSSTIDKIELYNLIGERKYEAAVSSGSQQPIINIESLAAGIYFVKAFAGENVLFGKVVKE